MTAIAIAGSLDSVFCTNELEFNGIGAQLVAKCDTLALFDGCDQQRVYVNLVEGCFVVLTMCVYAFLRFRYGRLEGDGGTTVFRRRVIKLFWKNQSELQSWQATYREKHGNEGDVDQQTLLSDVFNHVADPKEWLNAKAHYSLSLLYFPEQTRFSGIELTVSLYLVALELNFCALIVGCVMSACPESGEFIASAVLFLLVFVSATLFILCYTGCPTLRTRKNAVAEAVRAVVVDTLCDPETQELLRAQLAKQDSLRVAAAGE